MRIHVDPVKCEAHGLCAELLPERITLDEWGYPIVDPAPIPASLQDLARKTVNACPTLALRLLALESDPPDGADAPARRGVSGSGGGAAGCGPRAPSRR